MGGDKTVAIGCKTNRLQDEGAVTRRRLQRRRFTPRLCEIASSMSTSYPSYPVPAAVAENHGAHSMFRSRRCLPASIWSAGVLALMPAQMEPASKVAARAVAVNMMRSVVTAASPPSIYVRCTCMRVEA